MQGTLGTSVARVLGISFAALIALEGSLNCARADGGDGSDSRSESAQQPENSAPQVPSSNYGKARTLLPGEEVITPTGKHVKVWSTDAPVEVSPPPNPFANSAQQNLPANTSIVIEPQFHRNGSGQQQGGINPPQGSTNNGAVNGTPGTTAGQVNQGRGTQRTNASGNANVGLSTGQPPAAAQSDSFAVPAGNPMNGGR